MFRMMKRRTVVSFLVSGNGILFSHIARNILKGEIKARIGCVLTENRDARVVQRAFELGIPCQSINPRMYATRENYEKKLIQVFDACKSDLIVAAGYLRLLSPYFVNMYRHRIINVHPSLLPSFPGLKSQRKACDYGVKVTGCTTHFIDEGIDTGPIILQSPIWITDTDSLDVLSTRILKEEKRLLTESVRLYCEGKITINNNKTKIIK
jgi:phosphoribosylglycinamide formyltransferase 1